MNTNKNFKVIGIISQVIGIVITYGLIIGIVFFWFKDLSKKFGIIENLALIPIILIIYFLGSFNYELYWKYNVFQEKGILKEKFKLNWYESLVSSILIILFFTIFLISAFDLDSLFLYSIPIILIIPQIILIVKTNPNAKLHFLKRKLKSVISSKNINLKENLMFPKSLTTKEIYVISLIFGSIFCILLGYLFGETQYFKASGKRVFFETKHSYRMFNYVVGLISFIISSGICYLFLSKKYNKD